MPPSGDAERRETHVAFEGLSGWWGLRHTDTTNLNQGTSGCWVRGERDRLVGLGGPQEVFGGKERTPER